MIQLPSDHMMTFSDRKNMDANAWIWGYSGISVCKSGSPMKPTLPSDAEHTQMR